MAEGISSITDLPLDILVLVLPYLDAKSFLSLCSTCKAFQQNSIRLDPAYWSHATRSTFRVPNQPVVQHDGVRWQKLFRRLLTQSRVFTWGDNGQGRLGHGLQERDIRLPRGTRHVARRGPISNISCSFPTEVAHTEELGVIADMQCGGWSTTILTSKGALYTNGVLDGEQNNHTVRHHNLRFPAGFPYSTALAAYEEPTIAIQQFSSGRSHILGLSDSGRIWSWYNARKPALHVKFLNVDLTEASSGKISPTNSPLYGRVKQIVAGWSRSSAYIYGTGIVVWDIASRPREDENEETDTMLVMEHAEVPKTGYQRIKGASRDTDEDRVLSQEIGAVLNYIILESYVVFVTDIGRVFCGRFGEKHLVEDIVELRALRNDTGTPSDIQGTFRRFAIFKDGEVITTDQAYLDACWNARHQDTEQTGIEGLRKIPALQHNDVISVAFGDYHFLALHANGKITSYGTELQACGALGLGGNGDPEGRTRGVRYSGFSNDGKLVPHAYTHGRQVWFEPEKKKWVTYMTSGGKDPDEAKERMRMFVSEPGVQGELSEWFEQEGRDWDKDPNLKDADDDGLGSYFALSVSAAGWHSGAIVLVNEQLAERVRQNCIIKDPAVEEDEEKDGEGEGSSSLVASSLSWLYALGRAFLGLPPTGHPLQDADNHPEQSNDFLDPVTHGASPEKGYLYTWADKSFPRLKLSDGREMPGTVEFDEWRFGRPEWDLSIDDV